MAEYTSRFHRVPLVLGLFYVASFAFLVFSGNAAENASSLFGSVSNGYSSLTFGEFSLLFIQWPLLFLALQWVWIAPGVFLVWRFSRGVCDLIVKSFIVAFFVQIASFFVAKTLFTTPDRASFMASCFGVTAVTWLILFFRSRPRDEKSDAVFGSRNLRRLTIVILIPLVGLLLIHPYVFWQSFNPDGIEALILADSLNYFWFPRLAIPEGVVSVGIGIIAPTFPFHFFYTFLGPSEAAVRLPFLMFLSMIFCLVCELIEWNIERKLKLVQELLIVLALTAFALAAIFSAGYDYYAADISAPGSEDAFLVIAVLGVFLGAFKNNKWLLTGFLVAGFFSRPTVVIFLMTITASIALLGFENKTKRLKNIAFACAIALAVAACYSLIYIPLSIEGPGDAGGDGFLMRFRYLNFFDWWKIGIVAVPCGILPFLALFYVKKQDKESLIITISVAAYFALPYFMAYTALHHYFPIMVLPLVVFWRIFLRSDAGEIAMRGFTIAAFLGVVLGIWLSLPMRFDVERQAYETGRKTVLNTITGNAEIRSYQNATLLLGDTVIGTDWLGDPETTFLSSTLLAVYYGDRNEKVQPYHNYALLRPNDDVPAGMTEKARSEDAVLYIRDDREAAKDLRRARYVDYRSRVYAIPFDRILAHRGIRKKNYDVDLIQIFRAVRARWRIFNK